LARELDEKKSKSVEYYIKMLSLQVIPKGHCWYKQVGHKK